MGNNGISPKNKDDFHVPVLAEEVLSFLRCGPGKNFVDCTVGYGGLAVRILQLTSPDGLLIGIDRDAEALAETRQRLAMFGSRVSLIKGNFSAVKEHLSMAAFPQVDGLIFDLGPSSAQLDQPRRGFSFLSDGPLDMRMDQSKGRTARELVEQLSERDLADLIYRFGEERYARRIARAIVQTRTRHPLTSTLDLVSVIRRAVPASYRHGRIHCATRTFQALRIAVNQELEALEAALRDGAEVLSHGGRLCVISFHSLEDRIAKQTFKALSSEPSPVLHVLTKKPVVPSEHEKYQNPRARSAKLRVAERLPRGEH